MQFYIKQPDGQKLSQLLSPPVHRSAINGSVSVTYIHVATDVVAGKFLHSYQRRQINKHGFNIRRRVFTFYYIHSIVCTSHVSARKNNMRSVKCQGSCCLKTLTQQHNKQ